MASTNMLLIIQSILIGTLTTLFMDGIAWLREKIFQIKPLNYAFVGRWVLSWKDKKYFHENIVTSPTKKHEALWGWCIHYLIGIFWVFLYLVLNNLYSFDDIFLSILIFSLSTTLVPFLIMQPALGFGLFASKTPSPLVSIKNSLIIHTFFGFGMYIFYKLLIVYF